MYVELFIVANHNKSIGLHLINRLLLDYWQGLPQIFCRTTSIQKKIISALNYSIQTKWPKRKLLCSSWGYILVAQMETLLLNETTQISLNTHAQILVLQNSSFLFNLSKWGGCALVWHFRETPTFSFFVYQATISIVIKGKLSNCRGYVATFNPLIELPGRSGEWLGERRSKVTLLL